MQSFGQVVWDTPSLIHALQPILHHQKLEDVFPNVPKHVLDSVISFAVDGHSALQEFDTLRVDLNPQRLLVQRPNRWDFIPRTIFARLINQGQFVPSRLYNGYSLVDLGEVEESQYVRLYDGVKSPVFRIHPRVGHNDTTMSDFPTFTMEVGFTSNKRQLLENAARYVCMSQGKVNVAATLELDLREVAGNRVVLRKAVWSHWRFERKEQDMVAGLPAHTVFEQVPLAETRGSRLEFRGVFIDQTTSRYIAVEDEVFQIWPIPHGGDEVEAISLTYDDLHEDPQGDGEVAVSIPLSLIRDVIAQHCAVGPEGWLYHPEEDEYPVEYLGQQ